MSIARELYRYFRSRTIMFYKSLFVVFIYAVIVVCWEVFKFLSLYESNFYALLLISLLFSVLWYFCLFFWDTILCNIIHLLNSTPVVLVKTFSLSVFPSVVAFVSTVLLQVCSSRPLRLTLWVIHVSAFLKRAFPLF